MLGGPPGRCQPWPAGLCGGLASQGCILGARRSSRGKVPWLKPLGPAARAVF